ncbi:zf-HC2 domain-containing protein [Methylophaga nitratireducenticrescens]|uniref:Putative zinc-finger domain-containing protein n=1 Tax=Methylophaga nitratireducenticrescens TaxID=754476 RepID=I1XKI6_METNJ|nr:zf-HC2 domain-containing protein [Methylophaga nitratireducenticrescens]
MLKCREIEQLASDYLDQDLSFGQLMAFKMHLFICHNCRNYVRQLKITITSIKLMPANQIIVDDKTKELAKLLRENARKH